MTIDQPRNPFERSTYDPRYFEIAVGALKRGRRGEGTNIEVTLDRLGRVATLSVEDRERIAAVVDATSGPDAGEVVGEEIAAILYTKSIPIPGEPIL